MLPQDDIDSVLKDAQSAVDALVDDVGGLNSPSAEPPGGSVGEQATPASPPVAPTAAPPPVPQPGSAVASSVGLSTIERVLRIKVPLVVRLAERQMSLSEIMRIVPGTILEFERRVDQELDLLANHEQIGVGVAVKVESHFGLQVTYVGDIKDRIKSLAG